MSNDIKKLAGQQYVKFFKVWFLVVGIVSVLAIVMLFFRLGNKEEFVERENDASPSERVYDEADVLSEEEEDKLRELIEEAEAKIQCDIIVVTINQPVEGLSKQVQEEYGYRHNDWDNNMQDLADDFYDNNQFGYDEAGSDGDGVLFLDNWYPDQEGSWVSGSGRAAEVISGRELEIIKAFEAKLDDSEYKAYRAYVNKVVEMLSNSEKGLVVYGGGSAYIWAVILFPVLIAGIFIMVNLKSKEGTVTTSITTYVADGKPRMNDKRDDFLRKNVTSRVIQTNSSSGGSRSGGGGMHRSSGGYSHSGGGSRR